MARYYPKPLKFRSMQDIYRDYRKSLDIDQYGRRRRQYEARPRHETTMPFGRPEEPAAPTRNRAAELYELYGKQLEARKAATESKIEPGQNELKGSADQAANSGEAESKQETTQESLSQLYQEHRERFGHVDLPQTEIAGKRFYVDGWEGEVRTERHPSDGGLHIPIGQFPHAGSHYEAHPEERKDATQVVREWEQRLEKRQEDTRW